MASVARKTHTPNEDIAFTHRALYRNEAGASEPHVLITTNLVAEIHWQLKGKACRVYSSDLCVRLGPTGSFAFPDVVAVCGNIQLEDGKLAVLTNPTFIAEVLSPSTEAYDRGDKFAHYRRLPSLKEYLLVTQDKMRVERYVRQDENWRLSEISDPNDVLQLTSIDCAISLSDIYLNVDFPSDPVPLRPKEPAGF